jgi:trans-2,3-dihydro-3-hydroxyanthranilate isomerase
MGLGLEYRHVDVFTDRPCAGNGLAVFFGGVDLPAGELLALTAEMRQFESIFVTVDDKRGLITARIFTDEEELPFAGHPVIGAAAAAHERSKDPEADRAWSFAIAGRDVEVTSRPSGPYFAAAMNQGAAELSEPLSGDASAGLVAALGLTEGSSSELPLQVVSTGLPYLIVPVTPEGLEVARIEVDDFQDRLHAAGAKFVYVFDAEAREGRTWNNSGTLEDVATGSAAGPAAGYLLAHDLATPDEPMVIRQGRFLGRPSTMSVDVDAAGDLWVGGPVAPVATGRLD